jgi:hypothetical protein
MRNLVLYVSNSRKIYQKLSKLHSSFFIAEEKDCSFYTFLKIVFEIINNKILY